jgi:hypothetical protein
VDLGIALISGVGFESVDCPPRADFFIAPVERGRARNQSCFTLFEYVRINFRWAEILEGI